MVLYLLFNDQEDAKMFSKKDTARDLLPELQKTYDEIEAARRSVQGNPCMNSVDEFNYVYGDDTRKWLAKNNLVVDNNDKVQFADSAESTLSPR